MMGWLMLRTTWPRALASCTRATAVDTEGAQLRPEPQKLTHLNFLAALHCSTSSAFVIGRTGRVECSKGRSKEAKQQGNGVELNEVRGDDLTCHVTVRDSAAAHFPTLGRPINNKVRMADNWQSSIPIIPHYRSHKGQYAQTHLNHRAAISSTTHL